MAPPIHLGAWSMALMLWLPFELLLLLLHHAAYGGMLENVKCFIEKSRQDPNWKGKLHFIVHVGVVNMM